MLSVLGKTLLKAGDYYGYMRTQFLPEGAVQPLSLHDDIVFAEQRRVIVSIPGRYSLADVRDMRGERRIFACRAVCVSPDRIVLAAPVRGIVGERVLAAILHIGRVEGTLVQVFERGFAVGLSASEDERSKLLRKIEWLARHKHDQLPDQRANARFAPRSPYSRLMLPDGSVMTCFVVDLSISGAAVSAEVIPEVGTVVAVGRIVGHVVRHFDDGFSVHFAEPQGRQNVEARAICR
jgi:PilZ domain-containing protein